MNRRLLGKLLYLVGSLCFLAGTLLTLNDD